MVFTMLAYDVKVSCQGQLLANVLGLGIQDPSCLKQMHLPRLSNKASTACRSSSETHADGLIPFRRAVRESGLRCEDNVMPAEAGFQDSRVWARRCDSCIEIKGG